MNLERLPIVNVSSNTNYRIKICVNFLGKKTYTDLITDNFLLDKINLLLKYLDNENILYGYFQKSNYSYDYSIILSYKESNSKPNFEKLYEQILDDNLKVFGYHLGTDNKNIIYLSKDTYLNYKYYDFIWKTSVNSFVQVNPDAGTFIHDKVKELFNDKYHFFGIGGEMGIYAKALNKNDFTCLTNSQDIYDDCILNYGNDGFYKVDYDNLDFNKYKIPTNTTLVINISRNGLKDLAQKIIRLPFKQIIYIGCCDKTVKRDMQILSQVYTIVKIIKINQFPTMRELKVKHYSYVIELIAKN